jgi:putative ABC transport system permease protein
VVGVIQDFHLRSVRDQIKPMLYFNWPSLHRTISVRYDTNDFAALLGDIESTWAKFAPGVPLDYQVLEDRVGQFYESERRQTRIFVAFAALAAIIAAVGLLGLAAFAAERRTLEIGIRKTLGASTSNIITLMVPQFLMPVLLANLVALPVAWLIAERWLGNFYYRVDMEPQWFLASGLIALIIASVTVAGHARRVGNANPIHALRCE